MPLTSFEIRNKKSIEVAKCENVPPIMIIVGPNGVGKSTLLYAIKRKDGGAVNHTGRFLYIPPHRIWTKQAIQARFLWQQRRRYEDATFSDSLSGSDGVRISSSERTPDSSDESTKFIKYSLGQIEVNRQRAIAQRVDEKTKGVELDNLPDVYAPLKKLTSTLLPYLEFVKVDLKNMDDVKCIWKRAEGLDLTVGTPVEIDMDDLSSGEKAILTLFMPFIEYQIEKELIKLQNVLESKSERDITVLIDEPELHLHPVLEDRVLDYLRDIVSKDKVQFIITTHSTTLLNSGNFQELFLLSPKNNNENQLRKLTNDEEKLEAIRLLAGEIYPLTASRKILCIEGEMPEDLPIKPPDKKIYEILCPEIKKNVILPLGSKNIVIESTRRLRENIPKNIPGTEIIALIDRDQKIEGVEEWIYRLPVCMIENFLLQPEAINQFLEPYREKTQLKSITEVIAELKKITDNQKNDEIRIRIKSRLSRINEHLDGISLEQIKINHSEILKKIEGSLPNDKELTKIIEECAKEVERIVSESKELHFFRGKEILRQFYDKFIKNQVGISYFAFCMELSRVVAKNENLTKELKDLIAKINSK